MKKPKLLFVQTQAENAGAQEISRLLGNGLSGRGYDVHHLFFYRKTDSFSAPENTTILCEKRPGNPIGFLNFLWALFSFIRELKPDCILTFQHYGNVLGAPIARLAGVQNVIANQVTAVNLVSPKLALIDRWFGQLGIYHKVTTNSDALHASYADYPVRYAKRLTKVPHGFEDKSINLEKSTARKQFSLPATAPLIGCTARLNSAKQLDKVICLLGEKPEWHFSIAGQGPDHDRLTALAEDQNALDRVHFVGELDPVGIGPFLASLDVFAFPSAAESFGLAAVEAAQAGLPIVANNLPVLKEVLDTPEGPCALFVDVDNALEFSAQIERLLTDTSAAKTLTNRGRLLAEKYSLTRMIDVYEEIIEGEGQLSGKVQAT